MQKNSIEPESSSKAFTSGLVKPILAAVITWFMAFVAFFAGSTDEKTVVTFILVSYIGISLFSMLISLRHHKGEARKAYVKGFLLSVILIPLLLMWEELVGNTRG